QSDGGRPPRFGRPPGAGGVRLRSYRPHLAVLPRPGFRHLRTLRELAQELEGVDTGVVAIAPGEAEAVAADGFDVGDRAAGIGHGAGEDGERVLAGGAARLPAGGAGTFGAQEPQGVDGSKAIAPLQGERSRR